MNFCDNTESKIYDYLDGELEGRAKTEVTEHLQNCPDCAELYERLKSLRTSLRNLHHLKTSRDFETVLRTRISMEKSLNRYSVQNWPIRIPIYATAGVVMLVAALLIFNSNKRDLSTTFYIPREAQTVMPSDTNVARDQEEHVNYPWDIMEPPGFSISSNGIDRSILTRSDSSKDLRRRNPIRTVEF